jgi:hypothetical protein
MTDQDFTPTAGRALDPRRQLVERAQAEWVARLVDRSRRNSLLYFRPLKTGTLELNAGAAPSSKPKPTPSLPRLRRSFSLPAM